MIESLLNPSLAHFILRVVLGVLFVAHGYPKLFKNFSGVAAWFDSQGIRPAKFWVLVVGGVEFFGGLFLVLGILVQVVGIFIMAFAWILVNGVIQVMNDGSPFNWSKKTDN